MNIQQWAEAKHPFSTGLYNGLDYIAGHYFKHVYNDFGKKPEHATADTYRYQFRVEDLERVENPELQRAKLNGFIGDALLELERAERLWPNPNVTLEKSILILTEEAGEVVKAVNDYGNGKSSKDELKAEIIQTMAMCLRALKTHF
jgi:hypothetical protein